MDFAFLLLPYIIKVPSKNKSCASAAEVAEHFIQFYPVYWSNRFQFSVISI
jgi:hypothetical protein